MGGLISEIGLAGASFVNLWCGVSINVEKRFCMSLFCLVEMVGSFSLLY